MFVFLPVLPKIRTKLRKKKLLRCHSYSKITTVVILFLYNGEGVRPVGSNFQLQMKTPQTSPQMLFPQRYLETLWLNFRKCGKLSKWHTPDADLSVQRGLLTNTSHCFGCSVSFIDDTGCPTAPEQYKKVLSPLYCWNFTHPQVAQTIKLFLNGTLYSRLSRFC